MNDGEVKDLSALAPAPYNPRTISEFDFNALKKSIESFGDLSGVVFNTATGHLVGGHQRVKAFRDMKQPQIVITERFETPTRSGTLAHGYVVYEGERFSYREVGWPEGFEKAANVAANKIQGDFDNEKLAEVMASVDPDMQALTGHTDKEIERLMQLSSAPELPPDEPEPDTSTEAFVVIVTCLNAEQQQMLAGRLTGEGYPTKLATSEVDDASLRKILTT